MKRPIPSLGAALLAGAFVLTLPSPSPAQPKGNAKPRPALSRRAKLRAERAAKQAAWIRNADPQKMVTIGIVQEVIGCRV